MILRNKKGFTLVELLVVVAVVGVLVMLGMPNYLGAERKAKLAQVKGNMHTAQLCAEAYATDAGGAFAPTAGELDPFYPSGANTIGGAAGKRPMNPFTSVDNEALYGETMTTTALILSTRVAPPTAGPGTQGQTGYCVSDAGRSYAVSGVDEQARRLSGPNNGTLVLSNQ